MSWSKQFGSKLIFGSEEERKQARDSIESQNGKEATEQFDAAVEAVEQIIASGSIGDSSKDFTITMTGHSNPGHTARPNYSNDMIYLSITQK